MPNWNWMNWAYNPWWWVVLVVGIGLIIWWVLATNFRSRQR